MATKKKTFKQTAKLEIICDNADGCEVKVNGNVDSLTAALASLMAHEDDDNIFRQMMGTAIAVVLFKGELDEKAAKKKKKTVKKKAATKKKK